MPDENDYLSEDPVIRQQRYVCVSVATPSSENVISRELFAFRKFVLDSCSDKFKTIDEFKKTPSLTINRI